ncbi:DUF6882 domain-containing protein [Nocardia neocaledoniensis]|uniref:DUF6882 domain-containing protein n=1 Tax=Nocardia neocaledoniensis TaxID=236511 RepID=UPI0033ED7C13
MSEVTLANLLDDAALFSLEHQLHLADLVGDRPWSVDLRAGRFTFTGDQPIECTAVHLLGSAAPGPQSWLWSWGNPAGYPGTVTGLASSARDFGIRYRISELADVEVPFAALPGTPTVAEGAVNTFMDACKAVSGRWTAYNGPVGGGTRAAFLIEHPSFQLPAPAAPRLARVLQQGLTQFPLTDHRRALHAYANHRGLGITWSPDHSRSTVTTTGFTAELTFDELARTKSIDIQMG